MEGYQNSSEFSTINLDEELEAVQNSDHEGSEIRTTSDLIENSENIEELDQHSQPIARRLRDQEKLKEAVIHEEYEAWKNNRQPSRVKLKSVASGNNGIRVCKKNIFSLLRIQLPDYNEKE